MKKPLPIQFIGTQRSGSNLLRVMLNQLPEISAPHPPHILKTFYPLIKLYGNLNDQLNFETLVQDVCHWVNINPVPWEGFNIDSGKVIPLCDKHDLPEIFRVIYELKALHDGAHYWCCKSMESIHYVSEIEAAGLHPIYIHNFRDGRDVALSFLKAVVGPKHIYHLAKKWHEEQQLSIALKNKIPEERYVAIQYEELLRSPEAVMSELCLKLNIPYRSAILDYFHSHESLITAQAGAMWKNLTHPIMKDNHHKFLHELTQEQIALFEWVAGDTLEQLGYERITKPGEISFSQHDIERFDDENILNLKKALLRVDKDDLERRKPQEDFLKTIINRSSKQYV